MLLSIELALTQLYKDSKIIPKFVHINIKNLSVNDQIGPAYPSKSIPHIG